jgi:hypothetical protein
MSNPSTELGGLDFLRGRIVCGPEDGMRAINTRRTKFYELLNSGEIESYLDGSRRQIVVASLIAYVRKRLEAACAEKAA